MNRFLCDPSVLAFNFSRSYMMTQRLTYLSIYLLPMISFFGNALTLLIIFSNAQLNRSSFSVYVKSMAVSDTFVLVLKLLSYENKTSKYIYFPSLCTVLVFLSEATVLLSVWTIVLITIERTLVVLFPLHIKKFVSASRARYSILVITCLSLLFSARLLLITIDSSPSQRKRCHPIDQWQAYRQLNEMITEFAYCFIPLALVITGNCITLYTVRRAVFNRRQIVSTQLQQHRQLETHENQLMLMLFIVTSMFIVYFVPFTLANIIRRWGLPFHFCFTNKTFEVYAIVRSFCDLLKDCNFCTNFIIYCISGRRFRQALFALFKCGDQKLLSCTPHQDSTKARSDRLLPVSNPKSSRILARVSSLDRRT